MKEFLFRLRAVSFLILVGGLCFSLPDAPRRILKIESSISPIRLSLGQEGKVVLKITPDRDIFISPHPSFIIEFSASRELIFSKNFFSASDLGLEVSEDQGEEYLDLVAPIEIPFTVGPDAERGNHTLEGKIKYFACSKSEPWCLKDSEKFTVSFFTRRSSIIRR